MLQVYSVIDSALLRAKQASLFEPPLLYVAILLASYILSRCILRKNLKDAEGHPIPPGPPVRYAFLRKYPELALHRWTKRYGPIFSVWMVNQLFVVINDPQIARDLLVVRGSVFSGRWRYFMKNHVILRGGGITAAKYDDSWRKQRRIGNWLLTPKAIQGYASVLDYEAHMLVRSLYRAGKEGTSPFNPANCAGQYVLNNMLSITFGTRTNSESDPLVLEALRLGHEFMQLTGPWANMIDFMRPLQWIPTPMRYRGRKLRADFLTVYGQMLNRVKKRMDSGENVPDCLVKSLIECQEEEKLSWEDMCFIATAFTTGGVHSTSGVIKWLLAFMPSHPHIQARAHEELDRVIGRDSWPTAEDEMKLPYIRAVIKEILRVHSPFWMATPHCCDEDVVYRGMFIPKDTVIILNCYSLHHNENRYPDSFTFDPERYIGDDLSSTESSKLGSALERDHWAFGAGRRICPGMIVAERELWLAVSRILWCFTVSSVSGEPISLEEYEGYSGRTPLPYRVFLEPRHKNVRDLLEESEVLATI